MTDETNIPDKPFNNSKVYPGIIILIIGALLLLRQLDAFLVPSWLFEGRFIWPLIIIAMGIWLVRRRDQKWNKHEWKKQVNDWGKQWQTDNFTNSFTRYSNSTAEEDAAYVNAMGDDHLDVIAIFNNVKKNIISKSFKGGQVTNLLSNITLNFGQADIDETIIVDLTQIFCKTKIVVPANWRVINNTTAIFAEFSDKRSNYITMADSTKVLILTGTSLFVSIEIRNY